MFHLSISFPLVFPVFWGSKSQVQLETIPADVPNERGRAEALRRLGRQLGGRSWAAQLATQIVASQ